MDPLDERPCWHMRALLSAFVDGRLEGIALRYTRWHTAHCSHCSPALGSLTILQARLRRMGVSPPDEAATVRLSPERRSAVEASWDRLDREEPSGR